MRHSLNSRMTLFAYVMSFVFKLESIKQKFLLCRTNYFFFDYFDYSEKSTIKLTKITIKTSTMRTRSGCFVFEYLSQKLVEKMEQK